jgi:hypothetical protein
MITKIKSRFAEPLDRAALKLMAVVLLLTVLVLAIGDRSQPYVREFSWQSKQIGAEDVAFSLSFSRAMQQKQVEAGLMAGVVTPQETGLLAPIDKLLPGKISWSGKKLFYTLNTPVPYGSSYQIQLESARAEDRQGKSSGQQMTAFRSQFSSRQRRFGFIGINGEQRGRLLVSNFGSQPQALTGADLLVKDFRFLPNDRGLIFLAAPVSKAGQDVPVNSNQIYRWTDNRIELLLDNKIYQNIKFDVSSDGQTLVVQKVNRKDPKDFGIWAIDLTKNDGGQRISQGGSFMVTPDNGAIAVAEGQGVAIKPLNPAAQVIDFLPKFGRVLSFASNGTAAAMEKYIDDYTRELFLVTNQGQQKKLLAVRGEIQTAQFSPNGKILYGILAESPAETSQTMEYNNQPYLVAIDLATVKTYPLLQLAPQQGIAMSLAPDGRALLFDQVATVPAGGNHQEPRSADGQKIEEGIVWLLPLPESLSNLEAKIKPENLSIAGYAPRWAP